MAPAKAALVIRRRIVFSDGSVAELVVWRVPTPVPPTNHGLKYRLAYIVDGARVLGFDNERGKGDHRHDVGLESRYSFQGVDRLLTDFATAIADWRARHGKN